MASRPTGTLTFLFTDLEDSTRLVQVLGDRYPDVLADSRRIQREAIAASGGETIDVRADEIFAAFAEADAAVSAALAAQRHFAENDWPDDIGVRVRMGLHTGTASVGEDGYTGLDVHRAARISSAGHGGQVLLSHETRTLVGAPVRDLGEFELTGLPEPERLYQLVADDLPGDFPALRNARRTFPPRIFWTSASE